MDTPLSTIAVVGLGTMGTGIAEVLALAGREVIGIDISEAAARQAVTSLEASTARAVGRGRITEQERADALARFRTYDTVQAAADAELVIEVVPETYEIKQQVFRELDAVVSATAILATGTNALSVTRLAAESQHPERVLGLHFFNPAPAMKLVEVVSSVLTAPPAVEAVTRLARELGKEPVAVGDRPGFVADGLLFGYLNQAAAMYEANYASREDIDAAMKLGCGLPMGPLALLDLIGIDTARTVLEAMYSASHDRLHAPAPVLGQLSEAGLTGRKAGRGFYTYDAPGGQDVVPDALTPSPEAAAGTGREIASVGVAGSGTMASGIAEVFAKAGYTVVLAARSQEKADLAKSRIAKSLERSVTKGRLHRRGARRDAGQDHRGRFRWTRSRRSTSPSEVGASGRPRTWRSSSSSVATLDKVCRPAVLGTTTSSLPVIAIARATARPEDVIGMHFGTPAPSWGFDACGPSRSARAAAEIRWFTDQRCAEVRGCDQPRTPSRSVTCSTVRCGSTPAPTDPAYASSAPAPSYARWAAPTTGTGWCGRTRSWTRPGPMPPSPRRSSTARRSACRISSGSCTRTTGPPIWATDCGRPDSCRRSRRPCWWRPPPCRPGRSSCPKG
ncbi:Fatty acid oxidation complex subunit alpha [Streptomyces microflavus]